MVLLHWTFVYHVCEFPLNFLRAPWEPLIRYLLTLTTTKYLYFSPGVTITELHRRAGMDEETYQAFLNRCSETHVLGRPGYPDEIANAIAFLASDAASFITGVSLPVDGNLENIHNSFQQSE